MENKCPRCKSENVYFSRKQNLWICEDCDLKFNQNGSSVSSTFHSDLCHDEYWSRNLWTVAPVALALSYRQLYEYVEEQNVGCTLFLIRDVFELMIKIPVTIIFNGIHDLNKGAEEFSAFLAENSKAAKLYEYSMQMLSTGKWWECVRLASSIGDGLFAMAASDGKDANLYRDTILYLRELHEKLYFRLPGKAKVSMVTWRNRTLGHSCLADNPAEKYGEIPYILEMFKAVGEVSVEYYKRVCLADSRMTPLRGVKVDKSEPEVYIIYMNSEDGQVTYTKIHNFIAGRDNNLSCFDGFEKGKAYLLNYGSGERYRDLRLSEWLTSRHRLLESASARTPLSDENVFADNLETGDINNLEEQLLEKDDIAGVNFLGEWLMDAIESCNGGILLLTAERGLGKSTFCSSIAPLENLTVKYSDEQHQESLEEFLGSVAVRVWHFNSEYRSRKDIFIPGIRDALLTLSPEEGTQKSNRICGRLESQYNNLVACAEDLRSLYFAECLNNTIAEYCVRTDQQKLLLVFDGIDEVSNIEELCSFIPDAAKLDEGIYILLTCRTRPEIKDNKTLLKLIEETDFKASLEFTRETVVIKRAAGEKTAAENVEYREVISKYVEAILREQNGKPDQESIDRLAGSFEYRFSSLAAYRKLCRLSPTFCDRAGADLFGIFMHQIELNAPETYVRKLKRILNTLVCAGEPITLRELSFLSGERYVTYRLLGMMNDIQAFIKVTRSERGNCYELSHSQWEEAVKTLIPYGDIYFRKQCNELLVEMEAFFNKRNIASILEKSSEGELWLLWHIMGIYNRNWKELKDNWFEEVRIGTVEKLLMLLLANKTFVDGVRKSYGNLMDKTLKNIVKTASQDYFEAIEHFEFDKKGVRGYRSCDNTKKNFYLLHSFENVYREILLENTGKTSTKFEIAYDAAKLLSEYISISFTHKDTLLYQRALQYTSLAHDNIPSESVGLDYYNLLLLTANIRKKQKQYQEASNVLNELISGICSLLRKSVEERILLARAYAQLGTVYYYLKNDNELEMYVKSYNIICGLSRTINNEEFLKLKRWVEYLIGDTYRDLHLLSDAIVYWKLSLQTIYVLRNVTRRGDDLYQKAHNLFISIGKAYMQEGHAEDSVRYFENAYRMECEYDMDKIKALEYLIEVYSILGNDVEKRKYWEIYEPLLAEQKEYADAYQEVLEVLKYVETKSVDKIPESVLMIYKNRCNPKHKFRVDTSKSFAEQNLMEKTKVVFANIFQNYWATDSQRSRINEHDERNLIAYRYDLAAEILLQLDGSANNVDIQKSGYSKACSEIFWLLEYIPQSIVKKIPVDVIMSIKSNRDMLYIFDFSVSGGNNYLEETKQLFKYLIQTYVPDIRELLDEYQRQIPEDFDLAEIFEDEE